MILDPNRYTYKEIALASGINQKTVAYRARKLGFKAKDGVSYDQVKLIVGYRTTQNQKARPRMVNHLKVQLKNDGFKVAEK